MGILPPGNLSSASQRRGAAMVEFALVAPFLALVALGTIEFGQALKVSQVMSQAAREGARHASQDGSTNASVQQLVRTMMASGAGVDPGSVQVSVTMTQLDGNPNWTNEVAYGNSFDICHVNVSVPVAAVRIAPTRFLGDSGNLSSFCSMRHH